MATIYASASRAAARPASVEPIVSFSYHTYSGVLLYVDQDEHHFELPYPVAAQTLDSLFRHTVRYGFFAYGALLIPVLAYFNYLGQKRSIRQQRESKRVQM